MVKLRILLFSVMLVTALLASLYQPGAVMAAPLLSSVAMHIQITVTPANPAAHDLVTFQAFLHTYPPMGQHTVTLLEGTWNFGDGTGVQGGTVTHQYQADGDYNVTFYSSVYYPPTGWMSASHMLAVRTHDVTIQHMKVHKNLQTGKTRPVEIYVSSSQYDETVEVHLYQRAGSGDWKWVGSLTQGVPASGKKHGTVFAFAYIPDAADALAGSVIFKAVAEITGQSDAAPADNVFIAEPAKVRK